MLTTFDLDEYVYAAMRAGASGYLLKDTPAQELVAAVRVIAQGEALLSPSVTKRLIEEFARQPEPGTTDRVRCPTTSPTASEKRSSCWPTGSATARSRPQMYIGEATAKTHVSRLLTKLGVRDRVQAVVLAYETGLVRPGDPAKRHDSDSH